MNRKQERDRQIAAVKTVSLMLVIVYHCLLFYADNPFFPEHVEESSAVATVLCGFLDLLPVPAFVFASGFLFCYANARQPRPAMREMLSRRAKRLLVPYYLYGVLWMVPLYTLFDIHAFGRPDGANLLIGWKAMALGQFSDHLWFLWMLFWVTAFWIAARQCLEKGRFFRGLLAAVVAALVVQQYLADFPYFKLSQIAPYLLCFYVGAVCCLYRDVLQSRKTVFLAGAAVVLCLLLVVSVFGKISGFGWSWLAQIAGALLMYLLAILADRAYGLERLWERRGWRWLEQNSMELYLLHMPFPYLYTRLLYPRIGTIVPLCVVAVFALSVASACVAVAVKNGIVRWVFTLRTGETNEK